MYKGKKILAIIPARAGSKGVPKKNSKIIQGKPLIYWTIAAALSSKHIDRIVISSDSQEIVDIGKKYGVDTPFLRPKKLAADTAVAIDTLLHACDWLKDNRGEQYDIILMLQPTSPLRITKDIDQGLKMLFAKKAKSVVSVCEVEHNPLWANTISADGSMKNFLNKTVKNKNRQELPVYYRLNGAYYGAYYDYLKKEKGFFGKETFAYIMPRERSIDIDTKFDFEIAEFLMSANKNYKQKL